MPNSLDELLLSRLYETEDSLSATCDSLEQKASYLLSAVVFVAGEIVLVGEKITEPWWTKWILFTSALVLLVSMATIFMALWMKTLPSETTEKYSDWLNQCREVCGPEEGDAHFLREAIVGCNERIVAWRRVIKDKGEYVEASLRMTVVSMLLALAPVFIHFF